MMAIVTNLLQGWPGHQPARAAKGMSAELFVIRIKKILIADIEGPIARDLRLDDESLEEPCGMREVPFGGTHIRHGLQHLVFRGERFGDPHAGIADSGEQFPERVNPSAMGSLK